MYLTYLQFCHASSHFYDAPAAPERSDPFGVHDRPEPDGWTRTAHGEWVVYTPPGARLRLQGWKVHVSATLDNAAATLETVAAYCVQHAVPFKALAGPPLLARRNSKYADRGGSGKFVTMYPRDDDQLLTVLGDLDESLEGAAGPTILSDVRWGAGPLYVRYGAFVSRQVVADDGTVVECIEDPDGNLVPDERRPGFHPPAWAAVPDGLRPAIATRAAGTLQDFPYRVDRALHFSNGGGVYRGRRLSDDRPVLLKEARPHAGLDESGQDALARLDPSGRR